jgi:hypothetical protein
MRWIGKRGLTKSPLLYLLYRQGKHPKQFGHYFDQYFSQIRGDLSENSQTAKITFETFKKLDKRIIILPNFLSDL